MVQRNYPKDRNIALEGYIKRKLHFLIIRCDIDFSFSLLWYKNILALNAIVKVPMYIHICVHLSHDTACFPCNIPICYFFIVNTCTIKTI